MDISLLDTTDWSLITLGSTLSFVALGVFYCGLKLPEYRFRLLMVAGALMALAYWPWILSTEADRGIASAIALLMIAVLACIGFACQMQIRTRAMNTAMNWPDRSRGEAIRQYRYLTSMRWIIAGPVALTAAWVLSATLFELRYANGPFPEMPLLWLTPICWIPLLIWSLRSNNPAGTGIVFASAAVSGLLMSAF